MADRAPLALPLGCVLLGTAGLGYVNCRNAWEMAPNWGQDLAFFTQIVHRAASGGPWASPLLLEPEGMFEMVHTHLVLFVLVPIYALLPRQEVLLVAQAAFACLALWPAFRLGEQVGGRRLGLFAAAAALAFGPFQAAATCDFRASSLFIPGILGALTAARERRAGAMFAWACVAHLGRQEAAYLGMLAGGALLVIPWGEPVGGAPGWRARLRLREGALLLGFSILTFAAWTALKPEMFYHFDPRSPLAERPPLAPEIAEARLGYALRLLRSGGLLALLDPAALLAGLPMGLALAVSPKEWEPLVGPSAHYTAFWLPFLLASSIAGAGRLGRWGGPALLLLNALSFPWVGLREGHGALRALGDLARPEDRVAADYDTIHLFGQREVLWNVAQLELPEAERPRGWERPWPISLDAVDLLVDRADDPLALRAEAAWRVVVETVDVHVALRRR